MLVTFIFVAAFVAVGYYNYLGLHRPDAKPVTSSVETTVINGNKTTFTNQYFQFQDTGKWIIEKNNTTDDRLVYHKFRKNVLEHEMVVYVNKVPNPLDLTTGRVLPIRIINNNSFQVTNVSSPCGAQYAKDELHKVKELSINNAAMLCDPDTASYSVIVSEINANYIIKLKRGNGAPIQFVIIYKDTGVAPQPDSLLNITSSFKTI